VKVGAQVEWADDEGNVRQGRWRGAYRWARRTPGGPVELTDELVIETTALLPPRRKGDPPPTRPEPTVVSIPEEAVQWVP
jgi:hypothetical protein